MRRTALMVAGAGLSVLVAAGCGTADDGSGAATGADAQASTQGGDVSGTPPPEDPPAPAPDGPKPFTIGEGAEQPPSGGPCAADADCAPASCCHPKTCVDKARKPSCAGVMCTMDCRAGTFDCGGGRCVCKDGACAAELTKPRFVP